MPATPPVLPQSATMATVDSWCQRMGLRPTAPRRTLFRVIVGMPDHFDTEHLCVECQRRGLPVSRATVYRTLPLLCAAGLLRATEFGDGRHLYSRVSPGEVPHAEIYVVDCERVVEVPAPFLTWYAQAVTNKAGYELIGQRLQAFARCPRRDRPGACESCTTKHGGVDTTPAEGDPATMQPPTGDASAIQT